MYPNPSSRMRGHRATVGRPSGLPCALSLLLTWAVGTASVQAAPVAAGLSKRVSIRSVEWLIAQAAPLNDNFVDSLPVNGSATTVTGTNVNATKEPGEPNHAGNPGGKSVWWSWTAPFSGSVSLNTFGSTFSTLLAAYTGDAVSALTPIASGFSSVSFNVVEGTTYRIAIDGSNFGSGASTGTVTLNLLLVEPPANDNFADRATLTGASATVTGTNVGATKETGEPNHAGVPGGRSVWWTWTAPSSGPVAINTFGSTFDTLLAVYTGDGVSTLTPVAANDNFSSSQSRVIFQALAGTTYQIAVDGYFGSAGNVTLSLGPVPLNDNFNVRTSIPPLVGPVPFVQATSNGGATKEFNEPSHAGNLGGKSVWWTWTAPVTRQVTFSTQGSDFDTLLAVYTGLDFSLLNLVVASDDALGTPQAQVTFTALAGTPYQIAVDGADGASGDVALALATGGLRPFAGDFNGDGKVDKLVHNSTTGRNLVQWSDGSSSAALPSLPGPAWQIGGVGDFDGDGKSDVLWRHYGTGQNVLWLMDGAVRRANVDLPTVNDPDWFVVGITDHNGDRRPDILWRNRRTSAKSMVWLMQGTALRQALPLTAPDEQQLR